MFPDLTAKKICSKYKTDGVLVYNQKNNNVLIYNRDGSEAKMCGNGLKCLFHYCFDNFYDKKSIKFNTQSGIYEVKIISLEPFATSVNLKRGAYCDFIKENKRINNKVYELTEYQLGVLHVVAICENFEEVLDVVDEIKKSKDYIIEPNIDFIKVIDKNSFEIITHERGVGWTKSCATGVGASAYILHKEYGLNSDLNAITPGGVMNVTIKDDIIVSSVSSFVESYEEEI